MISREFEYTIISSREQGIILLQLDLPIETPDEDWTCRFQLSLPDQNIEREIFGIDGLQALLLAAKTAKTVLLNYASTNQLKLTWLEMDDLGLNGIQ